MCATLSGLLQRFSKPESTRLRIPQTSLSFSLFLPEYSPQLVFLWSFVKVEGQQRGHPLASSLHPHL
jgi:hypothetical protein